MIPGRTRKAQVPWLPPASQRSALSQSPAWVPPGASSSEKMAALAGFAAADVPRWFMRPSLIIFFPLARNP